MGRIARVAHRLGQFIVRPTVTHAAVAPPLPFPVADTRTIQQVFQKVAPSVVSIRAASSNIIPGTQFRFTEIGSGVLISGHEQVLTAARLVYAMDDISVVFSTGETVSARIAASVSSAFDLSILQLERVPPGSTVSSMVASNTVRAGDRAFIVGAPCSSRRTLYAGCITVLPSPGRTTVPLVPFFQGDALIDVVSSGAPMFNLAGEVIGVVSQSISSGYASQQRDFVVALTTTALLIDKRTPASPSRVDGCMTHGH